LRGRLHSKSCLFSVPFLKTAQLARFGEKVPWKNPLRNSRPTPPACSTSAPPSENTTPSRRPRCTAAQAEALRGLRDSRAYQRLDLTWEGFCAGYLGVSRSQVDRIIALLEEFGPQYFELSQLTRVSASTYRQLESNVKDGAIEVYGEPVPLIPENAHKIARAVASLRAERNADYDPWRDLDARIDSLVAQFQKILSWAGQNDITGYSGKLENAIARMGKILEA
jgi:hypothetical protein